MTALILLNFTYSFNIQPQAEVEEKPTEVSSENEGTTEPETESQVSENETTTKETEQGSQPSSNNTTEETVSSGNSVQVKDEDPAPEKITVTMTINCQNAVDYGYDIAPYLLKNESYTAEQGATVFDVLKALSSENGFGLKYQRKTYIQGIGGLNELDCGKSSGWKYLVNGEFVLKPASSYVLENGDLVEWRYITNSSE